MDIRNLSHLQRVARTTVLRGVFPCGTSIKVGTFMIKHRKDVNKSHALIIIDTKRIINNTLIINLADHKIRRFDMSYHRAIEVLTLIPKLK